MSAPPASTAAAPATILAQEVLDRRRQRNILIAVCTALMAVMASVSGLNVAQQQLAIDLHASQNTILWIINGYTVALAALLMPVGAIGDRWGRKPVLLSGLAVFAVASVGAGLATSAAMMIGARVLAGVAAAMIMPVTLSVITASFPEEQRAQAIGIWAGVAGSGGLVGLFVSSFMVDVLTWRWLFAVPLALVVVSAAVSVGNVPNSSEDAEHPFDVLGSVLSFVAIGGLVLGIHEGPERGWTDLLTVGALVAGVVGAVAFVAWERRHIDPLLDVSVFADRRLAAGSLALMGLFAVMFGIFLVLFPYFQAVVGWSALHAAVGMLPMAFVMMPTSALVAPRAVDRFGARATMLVGAAVAAAGLTTLAVRASVEGGYGSVLPGLLIIGLGIGLTMTPATTAITESLPPEKQGVASALNDTTRELGGAIGVALLGSILSTGYAASIEPALAGLPAEVAEPAAEGIGSAFAVAAQAGDQGPTVIAAAQEAFVDAWVQSMWVGVGLMVMVVAYLVVRGPVRREVEATTIAPETLGAVVAE